MLKHSDYFSAAILLFACVHTAVLNAAEPKPFYSESLRQIEQSYKGQPFLLSVWSRECTPCMKELEALGELKSEYPDFNLVLVSTDSGSIDALKEADAFLSEFGLSDTADSWVYASDRPEKLRYSIDKNWYGEMPRSYFYDEQGRRQAASGLLSESLLRAWINENMRTR